MVVVADVGTSTVARSTLIYIITSLFIPAQDKARRTGTSKASPAIDTTMTATMGPLLTFIDINASSSIRSKLV